MRSSVRDILDGTKFADIATGPRLDHVMALTADPTAWELVDGS